MIREIDKELIRKWNRDAKIRGFFKRKIVIYPLTFVFTILLVKSFSWFMFSIDAIAPGFWR